MSKDCTQEITGKEISIFKNKINTTEIITRFTEKDGKDALRFHNSLPHYARTPLRKLDNLSGELHVKNIFVKDESFRFGLNAFKGLGGSYAMFRILCEKFSLDYTKTDYRDFMNPSLRDQCRKVHFVTATDGNHGKGVSWAAGLFGCQATVFLPSGSVESRRKAIESAGNAKAEITLLNYDQTVDYAKETALQNGWILLQDTAWDGYEKIPGWIIDGYLTFAREAADQLGGLRPTHVFLQAGVGAMAGGIMSYLLSCYQEDPPAIILAEPAEAACVYQSVKAGDGRLHSLTGNPDTIMAGLNCGTPCKITWPVMRNRTSFFCACDDTIAKEGMIAYANPKGTDPAVISGESGAVTLGLALRILHDPGLRNLFRINGNSVLLLINTEGDTDPEGYRHIVYGE